MAEQKLDHNQRMFVLRMHAEGYGSTEIKNEIKSKYGITMAVNSISDTCHAKKHEPYVEQFKEQYLTEIKQVPIANKRIRLDDKEKVRLKLMKMIDENPLNTKSQKEEFLKTVGKLNLIHAETREEMEKKPQFIANVAMGNTGSMTDEELHARKDKLFRVLSGSAGRAGADTEDITAEDLE